MWVAAALAVVAAVAALEANLTTPRSGGRMDPTSTGPDGAHALVALLQDRGIDVGVAETVADAERAAGPDSLLLVAQTPWLADDALLRRLAQTPADLLLVDPTSRAREALAPGVEDRGLTLVGQPPQCALRAAQRAGRVDLGTATTYGAAGHTPVTSCYDGALVRYGDRRRSITVVGSDQFMTNDGLAIAGNAALAMNLAGERHRLIWYAPQRREGGSSGSAHISELIPENVTWLVWKLVVVVAMLALWKGRRLGRPVTEPLPVVVRASETTEGRGRLYRSRRARDRAAQALRTATLHRLHPRLGLGGAAPPPVVVAAVAARSGAGPASLQRLLFGPPPDSDAALLALARELDDIERLVAHP